METAELRARFDALTSREREAMRLVVAGLLNKQIAGELGTSEITVKIHRSQVMKKMGAGSSRDERICECPAISSISAVGPTCWITV
jgi:FixJ family two-component response regulator